MRWTDSADSPVDLASGGAVSTDGGPPRRAVVVGVVGARGGVGASTFAALLAARMAYRTATVLVDLTTGAGVEVTVGVENEQGPRWPDLLDAGGVPGEQVLAALPRWGSCAVLSADRHRPCRPEPEVVQALVSAAGAVVLDLSREEVASGRSSVDLCDLLVVVTGRDLASVGGILALRSGLAPVIGRTGLAVRDIRPGGLSVVEVGDTAGLPVLCRIPAERGLAAAAERGALPEGGRAGQAVASVARRVLRHTL